MEYLALSSDAPGTEPLVLIDGPPYAPWVVIGDIEVGPVQWETTFGSPYGTRGATPATARVGNRTMVMTLRGAFDDKAEAATYENMLAVVLDEVRRHGGWVTYRVHGGTRRAHWRVLARDYGMEPWGQRFDRVNELRPRLAFTVEPFIYGDQMDYADDFTDASVWAREYTASTAGAGTIAGLTSGAGFLTPTNSGSLNVEHYAIHTGSGYDLGDTEARARVLVGAVNTSFRAGVILRYVDASNMLLGAVEYSGAWRVAIWQRLAGTWSLLASDALTFTPATTLPSSLRFTLEGNNLTCSWDETDTATATLSTAAAAVLGVGGAGGKAGVYFKPQNTGDRLFAFEVAPFTYRDLGHRPIEVVGEVPGTAPAVLEVDLGCDVNFPNTYPWHLLAWTPRPRAWSRVHNGGFEFPGTAGWTVAGVSGVTGAASSITDVGGGYAGTYSGRVVTTAAANRGAAFLIAHRFVKGRTYRLRLRVRAASSVTNVRARLGVSGDIASSTAVALTTAWVEHVVDWTPTATVDQAYAAVETTAATATTFDVDAVQVYEPAVATPAVRFTGLGTAGVPPWGFLDGRAAFDGNTFGTAATAATHAGETYAQLSASVDPAGEEFTIGWPIDPDLIPPDDYAGPTRDVEVWARLLLAGEFTGGVAATVSIDETVYTYEWGTDGVSLVMPPTGGPYMRLCRLGTIPIADLVGASRISMLRVDLTVAAGTNAEALGVAWVMLVNPRARVCNPTGLDYGGGDGYPSLAYQGIAHVTSDGQVTNDNFGRSRRIGSFSGGIEIPAGPVEFLSLVSSTVPDAPTNPGGDTSHTIASRSVHLIVRPRYEFLVDEGA